MIGNMSGLQSQLIFFSLILNKRWSLDFFSSHWCYHLLVCYYYGCSTTVVTESSHISIIIIKVVAAALWLFNLTIPDGMTIWGYRPLPSSSCPHPISQGEPVNGETIQSTNPPTLSFMPGCKSPVFHPPWTLLVVVFAS